MRVPQCDYPAAGIRGTRDPFDAVHTTPNVGSDLFSSGTEKNRLNDNKGATRLDFNSEKRSAFYLYYFAETYDQNNPYPSGFWVSRLALIMERSQTAPRRLLLPPSPMHPRT